MTPAKANKYSNTALCFKDKMDLSLHNNWWDDEYDNFYISMDACRNTTA